MVKIHKIDPNADTIIKLKYPLTNFAVWDPPDEEALDAKDSASPIDLPTEERSTEASSVASSKTGDSIHETIEYHVSSSVLKLSSSYFSRCMRNFKEGIPNENDGRYHVSCKDWNEEAFLILLNALHFRTRRVPRSLPLDMLAKVAQLIEYYRCLEAIEIWTNMWIENLKKSTPIPEDFSQDLMRWMYVASIFELPEEFTRTTVIAIRRSRNIQSLVWNPPFARYVDRIENASKEAIDTVVAQLHQLLDKYRNPKYECPREDCSFECGSIHYGALTKGMDSLSLLDPYPQAPLPGLSVEDICTKVRNIKAPKWIPIRNTGGHIGIQATFPSKSYPEHSCLLSDELVSIVDGVLNTITGLQLTDFARI
ncbi:hypothetical protein yc1106_08926 [Curvularia clavata]|uniref:BTB domain-containing protein n=1 Tax=Curvularia clavata TaxID=95742 RepID=A0A9Q9DW96_CURCL|nr:hypothetical protein yc1106_08926 [Curvularia clavata]